MTVDVGVTDEVFVGVGVGDLGVALGFGVPVACVLTVVFGVTVGVGSVVATSTGVGVINITRIAPSSGTGETVFLPDTNTPIMITMITTLPAIIVKAAIVFLRSSIA